MIGSWICSGKFLVGKFSQIEWKRTEDVGAIIGMKLYSLDITALANF